MKLLTRAIVSNSEMIKNYKACREKAESLGKIFILKNNQPDAVMLSIAEYKRLSPVIEYLESLDENDFVKGVESLLKEYDDKTHSIKNIKKSKDKLNETEDIDIIM